MGRLHFLSVILLHAFTALLLLSQSACRERPVDITPGATPVISPTPTASISFSPLSPTPSQTAMPDTGAPYLASASPASGAQDVLADTVLTLVIKDDAAGIDVSNISLSVDGKTVTPGITGAPAAVTLTYQPPEAFAYRQAIDVAVDVQDQAETPNRARIAYRFTVQARPRNFPAVMDARGNARLNLIYYGKHTPETDTLILNLDPQYVIGNPAHGLWGEVYGYNTSWLLQNVAGYRESGIKVIGYLTAGYEHKGSGSGIDLKWCTLEMNRKLIKNMAEIDRVDGVFIDECNTFPDAAGKEYLKELVDYAHSFNLLVWGNVGSDKFDEWFFTEGGFDMMNSVEDWRGQELSPVQREWGDKISVTGVGKPYDLETAYGLTIDAWKKGLAYAYLTDGYGTMPDWITEFFNRLRNYAG